MSLIAALDTAACSGAPVGGRCFVHPHGSALAAGGAGADVRDWEAAAFSHFLF